MDKTDILGTFNAGATLGPVNETNMARIWNKHKQSNTPHKRKVFVGMSGGVDSSVASALLKKEEHQVIGVFLKPWQPKYGLAYCNWKKDRLDALKVAVHLGIPFETWDISKEYFERVTKYMIDGYSSGMTPNPDVMCNKEIKFGIFLEKAIERGADFVATGHYARVEKIKEEFRLLKGLDNTKDQSYFLWTLKQDQLKHCLFPLGNLEKKEVRQIAKKLGLPNYDKKDSQGVCFVGTMDMKEFLKEYIKHKKGIIKNQKGDIIGVHDGVVFYTTGQRHGFIINNSSGPYYITKKNIPENELIVSKIQPQNKSFDISQLSWVRETGKTIKKIKIATRYRQKPVSAKIIKLNNKKMTVTLSGASLATSGQSAVIYNGDEIIGGGVII